jgi:hypothetical protein
MRWAGHVVRVGAVLNACKNTRRKTAGKSFLGIRDVNGSVVLICAFSKEECKNGYCTGMD